MVAVIVFWLLDKPIEIRPIGESKVNTAARIALTGIALGARAYGVDPVPAQRVAASISCSGSVT